MFRLRWILLALLLLAGIFLRGMDAFAPFDREAEGFQGGAYGAAAHNVLHHGFEKVGWYPVFSVTFDGSQPPLAEQVYTNHPPTIPLLNWLSIQLLGESEWALRLPHLIASIAIVLLIYIVGLRTIGTTGTLIAVAMSATLPGLAFYGILVNYENVTLAFMMALTWAHLRWAEKGRVRDGLLFFLMAFLASLCDWPALLILPLFLLERILPRGELDLWRRTRATIWSALAGGAGAAGAIGLHLWLARLDLEHLGLLELAGAQTTSRETTQEILTRARELAEPLLSGNIGPWLSAQATHIASLIHPDVFAIGLLGLVLCLFPNRSSERARLVVFPGFVAGLLYLLAFSKHSFDQPPFWLYTLPFLCLAFGFVCSRIVNLITHSPLSRQTLGVVILLPFALLNVLRYQELRARYRLNSPTREVGEQLAQSTPVETLLYVPRSAGWNVAYDYYSRRSITPLDPGFEMVAAPLAAMRDLDQPEAVLRKVFERLPSLHAQGLLGYEHVVVIPLQGFGAARPDGEAIERILRERARIEVEQIEDEEIADLRLLRIGRQDDLVEGEHLVDLWRETNRQIRGEVRAHLARLAEIAPGRGVIYTSPVPGFGGSGPLIVGGRWFYFLPPDAPDARELLQPAPRSAHHLELRHLAKYVAEGEERAMVLPKESPSLQALDPLLQEVGTSETVLGWRVITLEPILSREFVGNPQGG